MQTGLSKAHNLNYLFYLILKRQQAIFLCTLGQGTRHLGIASKPESLLKLFNLANLVSVYLALPFPRKSQ